MNRVKKQFWVLNKMHNKLLPEDKNKADYLLEIVKREIFIMLRDSADKRKGK